VADPVVVDLVVVDPVAGGPVVDGQEVAPHADLRQHPKSRQIARSRALRYRALSLRTFLMLCSV